MNPILKIATNKKVIITTVVVVALIVVYVVFKDKFKSLASSINGLKVKESNLSITDDQATIIANNLLDAMNRLGTDDQRIIENLQGLNQDDLTLIIKKFGVKPYKGTALADNWISKIYASDKDLIGWLKSELSGQSLETVKQMFLTNNIPF